MLDSRLIPLHNTLRANGLTGGPGVDPGPADRSAAGQVRVCTFRPAAPKLAAGGLASVALSRRRSLALQAGDPHPEQPHRPRRGVLGSSRQRDGAHAARARGRLGERARAGDGGEVVQAHLDPDRAAAAPWPRGSRTARRTSAPATARSCRRIGRSRSKVRSRDSDAALRAAPTSPSCSKRARRAAPARGWGRSARPARLGRGRRASASVVSPSSPNRAAVFGPIPGTRPGGDRGEPRARLLARQHHEPGRLLRVGGDLRHELVWPDPHRAASGRVAPRSPPPAAHRRARGVQARSGRDRPRRAPPPRPARPARARAHHPPRHLAVGGEVGRRNTACGHSRRARAAGSPTPRRSAAPRSWRS